MSSGCPVSARPARRSGGRVAAPWPLLFGGRRAGWGFRRSMGFNLGRGCVTCDGLGPARCQWSGKDRACRLGGELAVGLAVIGCGGHRAEAAAGRRGIGGGAGQLPVGHGDAVAARGLVHDRQVVAAGLVARRGSPSGSSRRPALRLARTVWSRRPRRWGTRNPSAHQASRTTPRRCRAIPRH